MINSIHIICGFPDLVKYKKEFKGEANRAANQKVGSENKKPDATSLVCVIGFPGQGIKKMAV
jgi:hypothetical protein